MGHQRLGYVRLDKLGLMNEKDLDSQPEELPRRSQQVRKPNPKYANANVAIVESRLIEPKMFEDAINQKEWKLVMEDEMTALVKNQTWDLVSQATGVKLVSCKWVYKLKRREDGSVERFELTRLIARGFSQPCGFDYEDAFSPVAILTTIRALLAIATSKKW
ncbi:putative mitochondrial protein AtMg00820 [Bidens hawaiensis]|uniref:putative mitochondrial protein AtMg00820 n=1 Tax=Bidens hawaiensis TaxID=980011 RepID=UPI00404A749C